MYKIKGPPKAEKVQPKEEEEKSPSKFSVYTNTSIMQVLRVYNVYKSVLSTKTL